MSRKNEIKKDIWKILREVYGICEYRDITDKQNEFLNRTLAYLDENVSLRRKTDKQRDLEADDLEPLYRPVAEKQPEPVAPKTKTAVKKISAAKTEVKPTTIDINAIPEHLRKYLKA